MKTIVILSVGITLSAAFAQGRSSNYRSEAIADASKHERSQREHELSAGVRSQITEALGMGRFYKPGDRWTLAVSRIVHGMVHNTGDENSQRDRVLDPSFYEFRVDSIGPSGQARIEVVRVDDKGKPIEDAHVQRVVLTVSSRFKLVSKEYFFHGLDQPVTANLEGRTNAPMGFESFPVELPNFERAKIASQGRLKANMLPQPLSKLFKRDLNPAQTVRIESPDVLGRTMRVTWQRGDLWPAFVETRGGYSILIKQEKI